MARRFCLLLLLSTAFGGGCGLLPETANSIAPPDRPGGTGGDEPVGQGGRGGSGGRPAVDASAPRDTAPPDLFIFPPAAGCGFANLVPKTVFDTIFPPAGRNRVYTYEGLVEALAWAEGVKRLAGFATTGDLNACKREVAAFLAHVAHESGFLRTAEESSKKPYCQSAAGCVCDPASTDQTRWYYGRGPLQLSYNYHYCAIGKDVGVDLLQMPGLLATDPVLTWKSAIWFWMGRAGAGTMTCHQAITGTAGFGETVRTVNGGIDCGDAAKVKVRVDLYLRYLKQLGGEPEDQARLGC
jgi:chitinase